MFSLFTYPTIFDVVYCIHSNTTINTLLHFLLWPYSPASVPRSIPTRSTFYYLYTLHFNLEQRLINMAPLVLCQHYLTRPISNMGQQQD